MVVFIDIKVGQWKQTIVTLSLLTQPGEEGFAVKRFSKISRDGRNIVETKLPLAL